MKPLFLLLFTLLTAPAFADYFPCAMVQGANGTVEIVLTRDALVQVDTCTFDKKIEHVNHDFEYKCEQGGTLWVMGEDIPAQFAAMPKIIGAGVYHLRNEAGDRQIYETCLVHKPTFLK